MVYINDIVMWESNEGILENNDDDDDEIKNWRSLITEELKNHSDKQKF
jgi:hypothetical protein